MEPTWDVILIKPVQDMLSQIGAKIPAIATSLLILIIGWLIAKVIRTIVTKTLKILRFDIVAGKAGISTTLVKGGIRSTPAELIGTLVYWIAILVVFATVVNTLGLDVAAKIFEEIFLYIPNVIAAIFLIVLGMFLANFVAGIVRTAASNAGIVQAKVLGDITQYIIAIFAAIMALGQLKIDIEILKWAIGSLMAGICLALGLAFGLGCKEIAGDLIKRMVGRYTKEE